MKSQKELYVIRVLAITLLILSAQIKAQSDIKVACVGNSITQGIGTVPFPEQLDILLGTGWDAVNFGLHSRTVLREGDYPYMDVTQFTDAMNFQPDIVIIELGTNDSKPYNWEHGEEFYTDYLALVDTFAQLESNPEIWVCHPPKAFSGIYDISDSVIVNCIIPLIDSVVNNRDVGLIDLYSLTEDKPEYFSDGIHPTTHGNNFIAKVLFETLVDSGIVAVVDTNALLDKPVTSESASEETLIFLNDGDLGTEWISAGLPVSVSIALEEEKTLDVFQLIFSSDITKGYQYTIEGSLNSTDWTMLADKSEREDTIHYTSADTILPASWRYIRLTITSFSNSTGDDVMIPEFKALVASGYKHAPVIYTNRLSERQLYTYYLPLFAGGAIAYYGDSASSTYIPMLNFYLNTGSTRSSNLYGDIGETFVFYSESFYNGIQVNSDMTYYTFDEYELPGEINTLNEQMFFLYPNPFSSEVVFSNLPGNSKEISIKIYDIHGKLIRILKPEGIDMNSITWDGTDLNSSRVPSGVYYCILEVSNSAVQHQTVIFQNR